METVAERIARLAKGVEVELSPAMAEKLTVYIGLLAKWNKTINLTGFELDPPSDEALNRLLVEPIAISRFLSPFTSIQSALDIGSGGGSPAIPLKVLLPKVRFTLVESKARKCAFLREAVRGLELADVQVVNARFEELKVGADLNAVDLVCVRAVRLDDSLWSGIRDVLQPGSYVANFGTNSAPLEEQPDRFEGVLTVDLKTTDARIRLLRFLS